MYGPVTNLDGPAQKHVQNDMFFKVQGEFPSSKFFQIQAWMVRISSIGRKTGRLV